MLHGASKVQSLRLCISFLVECHLTELRKVHAASYLNFPKLSQFLSLAVRVSRMYVSFLRTLRVQPIDRFRDSIYVSNLRCGPDFWIFITVLLFKHFAWAGLSQK